MEAHNRETLRITFAQNPQLYHRVRPTYPGAVLSKLFRQANIGPESRVLEIGCGTGQLTLPLARTGCRIDALDIGPGMVEVARLNLKEFSDVQIHLSSFEDWISEDFYDAVVSATAFHWVDPAVRIEKAAASLCKGGVLAIISTHHVQGGTTDFFEAVQMCYQRWYRPYSGDFRLPEAENIARDDMDMRGSGKFSAVEFFRCEWEVTYPAAHYCDLLKTYSDYSVLDEPNRKGFLDCVGQLIDCRFAGQIQKRYMTQLCLGRRC